MERWGQLLYVKNEAFPDQTSAVFGTVSQELKAVELIWGERLFPDGSIEPEFREKQDGSLARNGSFGYPTKEAFRRIFGTQIEQLQGARGRPRKQGNFVNLLANAGLKARIAVPAGELQGQMTRLAGAMSLLMHAYLLRLPRVGDIRAKLPQDREELLALLERHGQSQKHRRAGGQAASALSKEDKKIFNLVDNMYSAAKEIGQVEHLINALLDVFKTHAQGAADTLVNLGDSFHPCDICTEPGSTKHGMVRSFCGHSVCVRCFGKQVMRGGHGYRLQPCMFGRCEAFQAVEVDLFVAFQGQYADPRMWMPPVARVVFEKLVNEGLFQQEQESEVKQWNKDLQSIRKRALQALADGDRTLGAIGDDVAHLRRPGAGGLAVLDGVAMTHAAWVSWIRDEKEKAVEELDLAVSRLGEVIAEAQAAGLDPPQSVGEYLGKTMCTLGMRHLLWRGQADSLLTAKNWFDRALETMVAHRCVVGQGHVHGHLGVWHYVMGALEDTELRMDAQQAMHAALNAYKQQRVCYEQHTDLFARVPAFALQAVKLNIGLLAIRTGDKEGAEEALSPSLQELFEPQLTALANGTIDQLLEEALQAMGEQPQTPQPATEYPVQYVADVAAGVLEEGHNVLAGGQDYDVFAFEVHEEHL
mmetsp:Transcript_37207/g.91592  ORF Transcript_37207/g.91592 Transcript_37207/m.91592 type:complete len:644 (-) Transcript_37207:50-1981(-)